jgi:hypothetical protein
LSREVLFEKLYPFRREREDRRAIDRAVVRLAPVALDAPSEVELVAVRPVPVRQLHQRQVRELAVDLREPDVHDATLSDA